MTTSENPLRNNSDTYVVCLSMRIRLSLSRLGAGILCDHPGSFFLGRGLGWCEQSFLMTLATYAQTVGDEKREAGEKVASLVFVKKENAA